MMHACPHFAPECQAARPPNGIVKISGRGLGRRDFPRWRFDSRTTLAFAPYDHGKASSMCSIPPTYFENIPYCSPGRLYLQLSAGIQAADLDGMPQRH